MSDVNVSLSLSSHSISYTGKRYVCTRTRVCLVPFRAYLTLSYPHAPTHLPIHAAQHCTALHRKPSHPNNAAQRASPPCTQSVDLRLFSCQPNPIESTPTSTHTHTPNSNLHLPPSASPSASSSPPGDTADSHPAPLLTRNTTP